MSDPFEKARRRTYKTYSHLENAKRVPSTYEITTTKLHYYPDQGFSVRTPVAAWYERCQTNPHLTGIDWNLFSDPQLHTYTTYVQGRKKQESSLSHLFSNLDAETRAAVAKTDWPEIVERCFAPLLFPVHGFQMVAAYIGQMAPASRITIVAALQAADERRAVEHIAQYVGVVRESRPGFADNRRAAWENEAAWQPLRQAVETLLVTYDWVEALVALNGFLKPMVTGFLFETLAKASLGRSCTVFPLILSSLRDDERWHREWSEKLFSLVSDENEGNARCLGEMRTKWEAISAGIAPALAEILPKEGE